jgi:hypothetical protein
VSPGALGFYQGLTIDMQSYLSNSADIQRAYPVRKERVFVMKEVILNRILLSKVAYLS